MSKFFRAFFILAVLALLFFSPLPGEYRVVTVDFKANLGLDVNGAGPLLTAADPVHGRIVLVHTNTSSVSLIQPGTGMNTGTPAVINIPIGSRVPQYLKSEAVCIDKKTGNIYVIGNQGLHIVCPAKKESITLDTGEQYQMVAVNEKTGDAFLVSGASRYLAIVRWADRSIKKIRWVDTAEVMRNLNQTPPPPVRKVVCDPGLDRVIAVDGYTSTLHIFSAKTGKLLQKRPIAAKGGKRWHFAGYNDATHHLYLVIETEQRNVIEALKIDTAKGNDVTVPLPGLTEGVGVNYNPARDEVYIPYDNHPSLHVVDFKQAEQAKEAGKNQPGNAAAVTEIKIPAYGNDASAVDSKNGYLYVSSWAWGEVEVIDLAARRLKKRLQHVGIIPHMFNMAFLPGENKLYIPLGASAVNGSFGAAVTVLDPATGRQEKVHTGWAPVECVPLPGQAGALVLNSEDECALVRADGTFTTHRLPYDYPHDAVLTKEGKVRLVYGPHQSYWPAVYIWASKNGILDIDPQTFEFDDRRLPRLAHRLVLTPDGNLYGLQNNWGLEKQFLFHFPDEASSPNLGDLHVELDQMVDTETTQRILKYDSGTNYLYIAGVGEQNDEPGKLQVYDRTSKKVILKYPTGLTPTDLVFDENNIYVANFDSDTVSLVHKKDFAVEKIKTGAGPFQLALLGHHLYVMNHKENSLQAVRIKSQNDNGNSGSGNGSEHMSRTYPLPYPGKPDSLFTVRRKGAQDSGKLLITSHTAQELRILEFSPAEESFTLIHREAYPFAETTVDTNNSAFYLRGQFADAVFEINRIRQDDQGRVWITDYLSGKLFILTGN